MSKFLCASELMRSSWATLDLLRFCCQNQIPNGEVKGVLDMWREQGRGERTVHATLSLPAALLCRQGWAPGTLPLWLS